MKRTATAVVLLLATTAVASAHDYRGYGTSDIDVAPTRCGGLKTAVAPDNSAGASTVSSVVSRRISPMTSGALGRTATSPLMSVGA
jgi:hypothetical protein